MHKYILTYIGPCIYKIHIDTLSLSRLIVGVPYKATGIKALQQDEA